MRVVVCWAGMQGYIASCLRALNVAEGMDLHVVHLDFRDLPLEEDLLDGIDNTKLLASHPNRHLGELVESYHPDIVFLCGWFYRPYRQLLRRPRLQSVKFVLGMDTPWTGSWRQQLNRIRLNRFMRRLDRVVVAGSRSREMAIRLGMPHDRIHSGLYGIDFEAFVAQGERSLDAAAEWPHRFLFAGRYVPAKALDVLLAAYRTYHDSVESPWPLDVCGAGPEEHRFGGEAGVHDLGYVQPSGLPAVFASHGVLVTPSREEPWGVAVAEAAATGLPLICSDACGAAEALVAPEQNGFVVPVGDVGALTAAMTWMHHHPDRLREMGARSRRLAQAHSSEAWSARMRGIFTDLLTASPDRRPPVE